jgi:Zn-dependent protease
MHLLRPKRLYEVMEIKSVKVYVHWSVLLIGGVILAGALENPPVAFASIISYYGVILLHESGHMIAAQRSGCTVSSIELYPIWGITCFTEPYSQRDRCIIAWAGVVAQLMVAVPLVTLVEIFGFTRFQPINAVLTIFGFLSILMVPFNLLPIRPLDGSVAWTLLPTLFRRRPARPTRREPAWRSWR